MLAVVKAAELLDFVDTPKQSVTFTEFGKRFMRADLTLRKEMFSNQVKSLRIFQTLMSWLEEAPEKSIEREQVIGKLPYSISEINNELINLINISKFKAKCSICSIEKIAVLITIMAPV